MMAGLFSSGQAISSVPNELLVTSGSEPALCWGRASGLTLPLYSVTSPSIKQALAGSPGPCSIGSPGPISISFWFFL